MRIYLTHCSAEKDVQLKETGIAVTPDRLYTNPDIQQFMMRCKTQAVNWAILSDRYGVYRSNDYHVWYEKHPDTVTNQEEAQIIQAFDHQLSHYDEIWFYVRPASFHSFYERVLRKTDLADRVQMFQNVGDIVKSQKLA
ncbi:MAG: hypothetical protein ACFE0I_04945 [Elainellaceae cyanobacterium]